MACSFVDGKNWCFHAKPLTGKNNGNIISK